MNPNGKIPLLALDDGKLISESSAFSIADISLFAYTHVAEEGGFDLDHFPFIKDWIEQSGLKMVFRIL